MEGVKWGREGRSLLSRACVGMSKQVGLLLYETSDIASLFCLSVIKLDQYDPLLEKHLQRARENPGALSYLYRKSKMNLSTYFHRL